MVVLVAMVILLAAATYFTNRLYGAAGMVSVVAGIVVVIVALFAFVGLS